MLSIVAATMTAATTGAALAWASRFIPIHIRMLLLVIFAVCGALGVLVELTVNVKILPQRDRETKQKLLSHGPHLWAVENGALLGIGFVSRLGTWLWLVLPVGVILSGDVRAGAMVYGIYGFTRLLVPSILATAAHRHPSINISAGVLNLRPPTMEACNLAFVGICATIVLGVFL